jgi:hypothetical protein
MDGIGPVEPRPLPAQRDLGALGPRVCGHATVVRRGQLQGGKVQALGVHPARGHGDHPEGRRRATRASAIGSAGTARPPGPGSSTWSRPCPCGTTGRWRPRCGRARRAGHGWRGTGGQRRGPPGRADPMAAAITARAAAWPGLSLLSDSAVRNDRPGRGPVRGVSRGERGAGSPCELLCEWLFSEPDLQRGPVARSGDGAARLSGTVSPRAASRPAMSWMSWRRNARGSSSRAVTMVFATSASIAPR